MDEKKYTEKDIALAKVKGIRLFCKSKLLSYRNHHKTYLSKFNEKSDLGVVLNDGLKFADKMELKILRIIK